MDIIIYQHENKWTDVRTMHLAVALVQPDARGCSRGRPSEGSPHRASNSQIDQ